MTKAELIRTIEKLERRQRKLLRQIADLQRTIDAKPRIAVDAAGYRWQLVPEQTEDEL